MSGEGGRPEHGMTLVALDWQANAACQGLDPALFFAGYLPNGLPDPNWDPAPAKAICASCPVAVQCREYADRSGVLGVWGATDYQERLRLSRRPRRNQGATPAA